MGTGIDLRQVLAHTNATERVQQIQQQHPDMQQRYFALQQGEERKLRHEQVEQSEDTEKTLIRDRQQRSKQRKEAGAQENKDEKDLTGAQKDGSASGQGGLVDIKV